MGLFKDMKSSFTLIIFALAGIFLLLLPWSIFFPLPSKFWFLQNKSVIEYLGEHVQLILYLVALVCLITIPTVLWKKRK